MYNERLLQLIKISSDLAMKDLLKVVWEPILNTGNNEIETWNGNHDAYKFLIIQQFSVNLEINLLKVSAVYCV